MAKTRVVAFLLLILGALIGGVVYYSQVNQESKFYKPFRLGLDLSGGTHLVYQAHTEDLNPADVRDAMISLKEVIERRVNAFGVAEPIIQIEQAGLGQAGGSDKLVVDLPGVTDTKEAIAQIGKTPLLEFKTERPDGYEKDAIKAAQTRVQNILMAASGTPNLPAVLASIPPAEMALANQDPDFIPSELTGKYLKRATVEFGQQALGPSVGIEFNDEGGKLFAELTKANIGKTIAIYLDGVAISAPTVREEIRDGRAEISGSFNTAEAKTLVRNLNLGALPVKIDLVSTQTVGATLGESAMRKGVEAGIIGFLVVIVFVVLLYRLPGVFAALSLVIYVAIMLALFKLFGVTLTAAGIAGFLLSIGIAVDANILIFERMKEELARGKDIHNGLIDGFGRAWTSIRDSNLSTIITSIILFWFGSAMIKGFALTLSLGVIVSMFTAITVTRTFLLSLGIKHKNAFTRFLFGGRFKI